MAIERHSKLFYSMLELIPAGYYEMKDEDFVRSTKYFQNKKKKSSKEVQKEKRMNAKRKRLNPNIDVPFQREKDTEAAISDSGTDDEACERPLLAVDIASMKSLPLEELRKRLKTKLDGFRAARNVDKRDGHFKKRAQNEMAKSGKSRKPQVAQSKDTFVTSIQEDSGKEELKFNRLHFETKVNNVKTKNKKKELRISLKKAEDHQKKIESMTKEDPEKGRLIEDDVKWKKAISKAIGIKQKDDPILLQRALKRLEKKKKRSQKEWKSRKATQEKFKESKQARREKNIKERIEKKQRKVGKKTSKATQKKKVVR